MKDSSRKRFVEVALGARVVTVEWGIQKQNLAIDADGKIVVRSVQPGTPLEKRMFDLLCSPDAEWVGMTDRAGLGDD